MQVKQQKQYKRKTHREDLESVIFCGKLGKSLKEIRLSRGHSMEVVANYLGSSHQQIAKYESGQNRLSVYKASKLCELYNITPNSLINTSPLDYGNPKSKKLISLMKIYNQLPDSSQKLVLDYIKVISKINENNT